MKKIECIIMDWAGTAVDYGCFAPVAAFIEAFAEKGLVIDVVQTRKPMGLPKIQIRVETFFHYQYHHCACVADGIDHRYEETYISLDAETGDEAVEEDGLKAQVRKIEAEALDKPILYRNKNEKD